MCMRLREHQIRPGPLNKQASGVGRHLWLSCCFTIDVVNGHTAVSIPYLCFSPLVLAPETSHIPLYSLGGPPTL